MNVQWWFAHERRIETSLFCSETCPHRTEHVLIVVVVCFGGGQSNDTTKFQDMNNFIHMDEKWVFPNV